MSRWLAELPVGETLHVELRPGEVNIARRPALWWRAAPPARSIKVAADASPGPQLRGSVEPWRPSVETLALGLRGAGRRAGPVAVVLSDHFARYVLLPWSESLVTDAERLAFARHAFREVYGQASEGWEVCLDEQPAGRRSFAAAVDRELLSRLRDVVSQARGQLVSVTPALADCINRHRRVLTEPEFCLATVEPGRITFAFRTSTGWTAVRGRRMDGALPEVLPTLLKQEAIASSVADAGTIYLCAAGLEDVPPFGVPGWKLVRLPQKRSPARGVRLSALPLLSRLGLKG